MAALIFVTGPVRSGKSKYASELALELSSLVTVIATCPPDIDEEMSERILSHRSSRPQHWETIEESSNVAHTLREIHQIDRVVIIDCLTLMISSLLIQGQTEEKILNQVEAIITNARSYNRATIVVSNEVGWGVVPPTPIGRIFRDTVGRSHQAIAAQANQVWLLVCGIPQLIRKTS